MINANKREGYRKKISVEMGQWNLGVDVDVCREKKS